MVWLRETKVRQVRPRWLGYKNAAISQKLQHEVDEEEWPSDSEVVNHGYEVGSEEEVEDGEEDDTTVDALGYEDY